MRARFVSALVFAAATLHSQFVFLPDSYNNTTTTLSIGAGGLLSAVGLSSRNGVQPFSATVDPFGRYFYTANYSSGDVSSYRIGATGLLTAAGSPVPTGLATYSVAADPFGEFVYSADCGANNVAAFSVGAGGELTPIGSVPTDPCPTGVAVDPTGRILVVTFAASPASGSIASYTIGANSALSQIGKPLAAPAGLYRVAMHPDFGIVFALGEFANAVYSYVLGATGALSFSASATVPDQPSVMAVDPSGQFVFVPNTAANAVRRIFTFRIGLGGVLTLVSSSAALVAFPLDMAVDPIGPYLYQVDTFAQIEGYSIAGDGSLTPAGTFAGGRSPRAIAIDSCPVSSGAYVPPVITQVFSPEPAILWPADHKMVDVLLRYNVTPKCAPDRPVCALSVNATDPLTSSDFNIIDSFRLQLRAERSQTSVARYYFIDIACTDSRGATAKAGATIVVPPDQKLQ